MPVLAVIPARLGATRLPRKPLRLLGGLPLIVRVYEHVRSLNVADSHIVATDHADVIDACAAHHVPAVMTASHHPSGTDRVAEVADRPEFGRFDVILNVQGDEPFVTRDAMAGAVRIVVDQVASIGTAACPASHDILLRPDVVKVVRTDAGLALYFSRAPIPFLRETTDAALLASNVLQHVGVYAYTRDALFRWVSLAPHPLERIERLEQLRALAAGLPIGVAVVAAAIGGGIDTEDDLMRANARFTHGSVGAGSSHGLPAPVMLASSGTET